MTAQRRRRYWIAAAAVLVATTAVATYELVRGPGESAAASERVARGTPVQASQRAAISAPEPPALAAASPPVDVARVEAALARMKASAARISREQIVEEQKRLAEAKARFEAIKVPEPTKRPFTDANGTRWIELRYESGEVRYDLAPEPEVPTTDSTR